MKLHVRYATFDRLFQLINLFIYFISYYHILRKCVLCCILTYLIFALGCITHFNLLRLSVKILFGMVSYHVPLPKLSPKISSPPPISFDRLQVVLGLPILQLLAVIFASPFVKPINFPFLEILTIKPRKITLLPKSFEYFM